MCATYRPTSRDRVREFLRIERMLAASTTDDDVYPGQTAPIIRGSEWFELEYVDATFGLIPPWSKDGRNYRSTYNARSETVVEKPSFRNAWRRRQFCVAPMDAFYEWNYQSGRAVRWRIERRDHEPLWVGGLWEAWRDPAGAVKPSFTLLTVNADHHSVMNQFHAVGDEKRVMVMLARDDIKAWLTAATDQAVGYFSGYDAQALTANAD